MFCCIAPGPGSERARGALSLNTEFTLARPFPNPTRKHPSVAPPHPALRRGLEAVPLSGGGGSEVVAVYVEGLEDGAFYEGEV